MSDRHLNLFYSYNRDNELIENNLTRVWIVSLRMLSAEIRSLFLQTLLELPLRKMEKRAPSFDTAHFALQGHFDTRLLKHMAQKYIITIATFRDMDEDAFAQPSKDAGDSIPDAWIFDPEQGYCFLVEAKVGSNPLGARQVISHAKRWLDVSVKDHLVALTWYDVLNVIQEISIHVTSQQEGLILKEFNQYLGFFGYRLFTGFDFGTLPDIPRDLLIQPPATHNTQFLGFAHLPAVPGLRFGCGSS
jgi:hypothetical protein